MSNSLPTVHMVVKNEDRFIYYAITSILSFAERILICDTGSNDETVKIINSINSKKIVFEKKKISNKDEITKIRQEQIEKTVTPWIWIVDGDEIYPKSLCLEIANLINKGGDKLDGIVVRRMDLLGDIYHFQSEEVGAYNLFGEKGHFAIRLINKRNIPDLHVEGLYPYEGYNDGKGIEIIHHARNKFIFTSRKLFHAMYLKRSSLGGNLFDTFHRSKYKIEVGNKITKDIDLPEIFFDKKVNMIHDVTSKRSLGYELLAGLITPFKMLKRKLL